MVWEGTFRKALCWSPISNASLSDCINIPKIIYLYHFLWLNWLISLAVINHPLRSRALFLRFPHSSSEIGAFMNAWGLRQWESKDEKQSDKQPQGVIVWCLLLGKLGIMSRWHCLVLSQAIGLLNSIHCLMADLQGFREGLSPAPPGDAGTWTWCRFHAEPSKCSATETELQPYSPIRHEYMDV